MEIYIFGVIASLIYLVLWEYFVDHNRNLKNVTKKEWLQDIGISLFSWLAFILCIVITIYKIKGGQKA